MKFTPGQKVKVFRHHSGNKALGVIDSELEAVNEVCYWVNFDDNVALYTEDELTLWNSEVCDCGSEKTGISNRHAYWCQKYENI